MCHTKQNAHSAGSDDGMVLAGSSQAPRRLLAAHQAPSKPVALAGMPPEALRGHPEQWIGLMASWGSANKLCPDVLFPPMRPPARRQHLNACACACSCASEPPVPPSARGKSIANIAALLPALASSPPALVGRLGALLRQQRSLGRTQRPPRHQNVQVQAPRRPDAPLPLRSPSTFFFCFFSCPSTHEDGDWRFGCSASRSDQSSQTSGHGCGLSRSRRS
jgi:hypothetical protein